jgi:hypothetical protein
MSTYGRKSGFRLHQEVVGFHVGIRVSLAVSCDVERDKPGVTFPQLRRAKTAARRGTGCQVLNEYIGLCQNLVNERGISRVLDIGDEAFLAAVEPDEVRRLA